MNEQPMMLTRQGREFEISDPNSGPHPKHQTQQPVKLFFILIAAVTVWPTARAEDPPAGPDQVLSGAGLVLNNRSYILESEAEANSIRSTVDRTEDGLRRMEVSFLGRRGRYEAMARQSGQGQSEWQALDAIVTQMAADMEEIWYATQRYSVLVEATQRQYGRLAGDPQIKAALRAVNKGRRPKVTLGPVVAYQKNVVNQSIELLKTLGYRQEGNLYWLAEEDGLIKLGDVVARLWREIVANARPGTLPGQTAPAKAAAKPLTAAQIAFQRANFVEYVHALRLRVDTLQKRWEALLTEGEARDALEEINRTHGKTNQAQLGTRPGLTALLQNLEAMEAATQKLGIPLAQGGEPKAVDEGLRVQPVPPGAEPPPAPPRRVPDLTRLARYNVLNVPDGDSIILQKPGGMQRVRLLGVTSPPVDGALLRTKVLDSLIHGQSVALEFDPGWPPEKGLIAAWVYRTTDGMLVNLEMVKRGYSAAAPNAPESRQAELQAAEHAARSAERGLWSPAARDEAAALTRAQQKREQDRRKELQGKAEKKQQKKQPARDWRAAVNEQDMRTWIAAWA